MKDRGRIQNGRYSLLKKLGEGGKGIVFKAWDTTLNRVVAIKVLKSVALLREYIALAHALRGMQFRAERKWQESIDNFEKSLQESEDINLRRWDAYKFANRLLVEYARIYLERDQEGDREKAHKLLDEALEIFQKMGAKGDIEKVIATKKLLTA